MKLAKCFCAAICCAITITFCSGCGNKLTSDEQMVYDALIKASDSLYAPESVNVYACSNIISVNNENYKEMENKYFVRENYLYPGVLTSSGKLVLIQLGLKTKGDYNANDVYVLCIADNHNNSYGECQTYSDYLHEWYGDDGDDIRNIVALSYERDVLKERGLKIAKSGSYWITDSGDIDVSHLNAALKEHWKELGIQS